jgi:hypothetical protein
MHQSGTGFSRRFLFARLADVKLGFGIGFAPESHVFAEHQERRTIDPGMPAFKSIKFGARKARQHFRFGEIAARGYHVH